MYISNKLENRQNAINVVFLAEDGVNKLTHDWQTVEPKPNPNFS